MVEDELEGFKVASEIDGNLSGIRLNSESACIGALPVHSDNIASDEATEEGSFNLEHLNDAGAVSLEGLLEDNLALGVEHGHTLI